MKTKQTSMRQRHKRQTSVLCRCKAAAFTYRASSEGLELDVTMALLALQPMQRAILTTATMETDRINCVSRTHAKLIKACPPNPKSSEDAGSAVYV